ncbi:putative protein-serine/threonine kinase CMGC-GSK family [Helianthus annuus]|nr:putative protein-serine/threonine kinase CMGC-GSK family [Helianthus annuus]KAJ0760364.1 putative protein-serine/threonine kinase CMGC-GSK family [Helianthus annuus]
MAERVVGTGSFGTVFQAKCLETGDTVAIKKVLQDRRYKNRELQLMRAMDHPNIVSLKHCFFSTTSRVEVFLNLVMEYVPETIYRVLKRYENLHQSMPLIYVKLYTYQIFRGLAYMHMVTGVCHRDLKPQNVLVDPLTHQVKICDFGSANKLVRYLFIFRILSCGYFNMLVIIVFYLNSLGTEPTPELLAGDCHVEIAPEVPLFYRKIRSVPSSLS